MTLSAEKVASNVTKLTSFPDVAFRIHEMLEDENSGVTEIGAVIEPDPALTAAMLRIANSAIYNIGGTVTSIERAITIVGLREVRDLAFGICATGAFKGIPNKLITVEHFWKHSLYCAAAAQQIAKRAHVCAGESMFTAGLLHDIGQLVMYNQCPELSVQALELSLFQNDGLTPHHSEKEVFGFDHMMVGSALAKLWHFPESLQECIEFHHEPFEADCPSDAMLVVHVANCASVLAELGSQSFSDAPPIHKHALGELNLTEDDVLETAANTQEAVEDLLHIFVH